MAVAEQQTSAITRPILAAAEEAKGVRALRRRFLTLSLILLLLTALLSGWLGLRYVEQRLEAEILPSSRAIGTNLAQQFEVALAAGVPFDRLVGVEPFLATAAGFDERVAFTALLDPEGQVRYAAGPASNALPAQLPISARSDRLLRIGDQLAEPQPLHSDEQLQGYAVVGLYATLTVETLRNFGLAALLIVLALGVLLREMLVGILFQNLDRPAEALSRLSEAVEQGDLSRTTWLEVPGRLGHLIDAFRHELVAVNGRFHAFLLAAFATRAGHFDPATLREVTDVVRRCLANYRLPPVAGAWPVSLSEAGLYRLAAFSLLLGEALLAPSWRVLPALAEEGPLDAVTLSVLPLLLALPVGSEMARRLLVGFAPSLIFTAGALLAPASALSLVLADSLVALVALRLLSGVGIGMALQPFGKSGVLPHALAMAFVAGAPPGFLALLLVGPEVTAPVAALVIGAAGLLVGQMLPAGEGAPEEDEAVTKEGTSWAGLLPAAALAGTGVLLPLIAQLTIGATRANVSLLLASGLGFLLASVLAHWIKLRPRPAAIAAAAAAVLLLLGAFAWGTETFGPLLVPALILVVVVFLGPRPMVSSTPAAATLAAAGAFTGSLLLTSAVGLGVALLLPAALLLLFALSWRRT